MENPQARGVRSTGRREEVFLQERMAGAVGATTRGLNPGLTTHVLGG